MIHKVEIKITFPNYDDGEETKTKGTKKYLYYIIYFYYNMQKKGKNSLFYCKVMGDHHIYGKYDDPLPLYGKNMNFDHFFGKIYIFTL